MLRNSREAVRLLQSATQLFSIVFSKSFLLPSALALLCDVRVQCLLHSGPAAGKGRMAQSFPDTFGRSCGGVPSANSWRRLKSTSSTVPTVQQHRSASESDTEHSNKDRTRGSTQGHSGRGHRWAGCKVAPIHAGRP